MTTQTPAPTNGSATPAPNAAPVSPAAATPAAETAPTVETAPTAHARSTLILQLARAACHLLVVVIVCIWAFVDWPQPWPGLLTGFGFTALAVLIWALFLSPRPVLHTDRFGQALIELLFIASGVGAILALGAHWAFAVGFGIVAAALGYIVSTRQAY